MSIEDMTPEGFGEWPEEAQKAWLRDCTNGTLAAILVDELARNAPEGRTRETITKEQRVAMITSLAMMKFGE